MEPESIGPEQSNLPTISIEIDWEQYFRDFCETHGKYPVYYNGVLLFPDGWRYSSTDHMGPEYAPPDDASELRILLIGYWVRRNEIVSAEYQNLRNYILDIESLQRGKSVSLSHVVQYENEETKEITLKSQKLDLTTLRKRLEWLGKDVLQCEQRLKELHGKRSL